MQSLAPLTLADFTAKAVSPLNKIELYYGGAWQTPEAIIHAELTIQAFKNLTAVDANSAAGQPVLNVASTAGYSVGEWIVIDRAGDGDGPEIKKILSIQAGISLTLTANLTGTYTDESVESFAPLLMNMSTSMAGADPTLSIIMGTWSATIYNPHSIFHPLNPTTTYIDVFEIGRKVRLSSGLRVSGVNYYWPVMYGIISKVDYNLGYPRVIEISGMDYGQILSDYKLQRFTDLTFGGTRQFVIATGAGDNAVTNGDFEVNANGWTAVDCTLSIVGGGQAGNCVELQYTGGDNQWMKQTLTGLVIGGRYTASFYAKTPAVGAANPAGYMLRVGTADAGPGMGITGDVAEIQGTITNVWTQISVDFVAPAATLYFALLKTWACPGKVLFDTASITISAQKYTYPMDAGTYPGDPAAKGCWLLRQQISPGVYQEYFENEDFTWNSTVPELVFHQDWNMPAPGTIFLAHVFEAYAPEDVVFYLLYNAGLYTSYALAKAGAVYTPTGITIDRVSFEPGTTALEAIRQVAERSNYKFYFRYDGKPVFIPKPAIKADPLEDLALLKNHIADIEYIKNDGEFFNRVTITGELQEHPIQIGGADKKNLVGTDSDPASIAACGEKNLDIPNILWQTQAEIDASATALLAELILLKNYLKFNLQACPLPVEWGDTIETEIQLESDITVVTRGLVRDIKVTDFSQEITLEL